MSEPSYLCSECGAECEPQVMPDIDKSGDVHPSCHRRAEVLQGDAWCDGPLKMYGRHSICTLCNRWAIEEWHRPCLTDDQQRDIVEQYWKESDELHAENRGRAWGGLEE